MQNLHSSAEVGPAAEKGSDAAAKDAAENPVAAAISLPLQNNTFYGVGPYRRAENELLIEPVVPIRLSENWMVISLNSTSFLYTTPSAFFPSPLETLM